MYDNDIPYHVEQKCRNVGFHNVAIKTYSANTLRHDVRRTLPFQLPDLSGCTLLEVGHLQKTILLEASLRKQVCFKLNDGNGKSIMENAVFVEETSVPMAIICAYLQDPHILKC